MAYFKYLYFNYLTTLQINTQNNLGFSHALEAARAVWLNTQNCAWCGRQISVIYCKDSGALYLDPAGGLPSPSPVPSLPPNDGYATGTKLSSILLLLLKYCQRKKLFALKSTVDVISHRPKY